MEQVKIDDYRITRVQSFGYQVGMDYEETHEQGEDVPVGYAFNEIVQTSADLVVADWGTVDLLVRLMGKGSGLSTSNNAATVNESHLQNAITDMIVMIEEDDRWERSVWLPNMHLSSFNFSYNTSGISQERYRLVGDADYDFPNIFKEVNVSVGTYATSSTFTVPTSSTGRTRDFITINGVIYDDSHFSWSGTTVTITSSALTGTLKSGDRLRLVWHLNSPSTVIPDLTTSGFSSVYGSQVNIGLGSQAYITTSSKTLDVQSVEINGDIEWLPVTEIGGDQIADWTFVQANINVTVVVKRSNLKSYALFNGITEGEWNSWSSNAEVLYAAQTMSVPQRLIVQVKDSGNSNAVFKTITIDNLTLVGSDRGIQVKDGETMTFRLKGFEIEVAGNGVPSGSSLDVSGVFPS